MLLQLNPNAGAARLPQPRHCARAQAAASQASRQRQPSSFEWRVATVVPEARADAREGHSRPRKRSRGLAAAMRHGRAAGVPLRGWADALAAWAGARKPWATQAQRGKVGKRLFWGASRKPSAPQSSAASPQSCAASQQSGVVPTAEL